jgi:hypothetical protein
MVKTLYNIFPKSGTYIIAVHREIVGSHIRLFDDKGEFITEKEIAGRIESFNGDCTGHIPYSKYIEDWLHKMGIRHVFIRRDLRDVALSLTEYVTMLSHKNNELNIVMSNGKRLSEQSDVLLSAISVVSNWYKRFAPWEEKADAVYTFEELRGAALLMGRENESVTFRTGQSGAWRFRYEAHHKRLADEVLKWPK